MKQILILMFVFNYLINLVINEICDKDNPILKDGQCQNIYCSEEDFENDICQIANPIINIQRLNDIIFNYGEKSVDFSGFIKLENGDILSIAYDSYNSKIKYIDIFNSSNNSPYDSSQSQQISTSNFFSSINGIAIKFEDGEYPLICDPSNCILFDMEKHYYSIISFPPLLGYDIHKNIGFFNFKLANLNNKNKILFGAMVDYGIKLSIITFLSKDLKFSIDNITTNKNTVSTGEIDKLSCFVTKKGYIECFYFYIENIILDYRVAIYDEELNLLNILSLDSREYFEGDFSIYYIDCIHFKDEIGLFSYYKVPSDNTKPILFLQINELIEDNKNNNYTFRKFESQEKIRIALDEVSFYDLQLFDYSTNECLMKINNNKFSYLYYYSNPMTKFIVLVLFDLYNNDKNLIIRYYKINFDLYNININSLFSLKSFLFNSNIGISFIPTILDEIDDDLILRGEKQITIIFGFIYYDEKNLTLEVYQNYEFKINDYFNYNITNNLFGYQLKYKIALVSDSLQNMKFISLNNNNDININDIINDNDTLIFQFDNSTNITIEDEHFIEISVLVYEPEYEESLLFCDKSTILPNSDPKYYYERKIIQEKKYKIGLKFNCYETCESCIYAGFNIYYQKCTSCKQNNYKDICYMEKDNNCYNVTDSNFKTSEDNKCIPIIIPTTTSDDYYLKEHYTETYNSYNYNYEELIKGELNFEIIPEYINKIFEKMINLIEKGFLENQTNNEYILFGNNITVETTLSNNQKYYLENEIIHNRSIIDLSELEKSLNYNKSLILIKIDIYKNNSITPQVEYIIIDPETYKIINITSYKSNKIDIYLPFNISNDNYNLYKYAKNQGYDIFNPKDSFYNDICTTFDSEDKTDVLIDSRKKDYFHDYNFCEDGCEYDKINTKIEKVKCICEIKTEIKIDNQFSSHKLLDKFYDIQSYTNIRIIICYNSVMSVDIFTKFNFGNYILLSINCSFIGLMIFNLITDAKKIDEILNALILQKEQILNLDNVANNIKNLEHNNLDKGNINQKKKRKKKKKKRKSNNNNIYNSNPPKNVNNNIQNININNVDITKEINPNNNCTSNNTKDIIIFNNNNNLEKENIQSNNIITNQNKNNVNKYYEFIINNIEYSKRQNYFNPEELNSLEYELAIQIDNRNYFQYYWSLLKLKHLIIFTFITNDDYNIFLLKLCFFLISFSLYFTVNALFFSDDSINNLYEEKGRFNFLYQIPQILYSTIVSTIINLILKKLSLSQKDILEVKQNLEISKVELACIKVKKCLKIKRIIFMIIGCLLLLFFWYYLSCFCSVFVNTQISLIKDTLISYCLSLIYPFGINLLPGLLRIPAIKNKNQKFLYILSRFISLI